jgi:hypothetical protein
MQAKWSVALACVVVGLTATAAGSLPQKHGAVSAAGSARTPRVSAIETAHAIVGVNSVYDKTKGRSEPRRACDDLEVWFLDPTCLKKHKNSARLKSRVATVQIGQAATSGSPMN